MREFHPWRTIRRAFGAVFGNIALFSLSGWGWISVIYGVSFVAIRIAENPSPFGAITLILAWASFSVFWYRVIILRRYPGGFILLRFWRREARFLFLSVTLLVVTLTPTAIVVIGVFLLRTQTGGLSAGPWVIILLAITLACSMVGARLSMVLPAAAIEDRSITFRRSWEITRGNTLPIWGGLILCILPFLIAGQMITAGAIYSDERAIKLFLGVVSVIVLFGQVAVSAAFLSFTYIALVGGTEGRSPALGGRP